MKFFKRTCNCIMCMLVVNGDDTTHAGCDCVSQLYKCQNQRFSWMLQYYFLRKQNILHMPCIFMPCVKPYLPQEAMLLHCCAVFVSVVCGSGYSVLRAAWCVNMSELWRARVHVNWDQANLCKICLCEILSTMMWWWPPPPRACALLVADYVSSHKEAIVMPPSFRAYTSSQHCSSEKKRK